MRLIDADALIEAMEERKKIWLSKCEYNDAIEEVKEAPTIERPHGEWKIDNKIYCSECGESICDFIPNPTDAVGLILSNNFCLNCGADMRPKEGEAE